MSRLQAQADYQYQSYLGERNYLSDLFAAKRAYQAGRFEADMLTLQGKAEQARLAHMEAMSAQNAQRERMNLQHQADMARINARFSDLGRVMARHAGDHEAARYSLQAGNAMASQRAALAANGVVMHEGSAQELQDTAEMMTAIDIQSIRNNAINEAFGYTHKASDLLSQAGMAEANMHTIHGQYFGSAGVRTQYVKPRDLSRYVTRQPIFDQSGMSRPGMTLATSLIGAASNFHQRWDSIYNKKPMR
ncbi:MAG: hypothetical protein Q4A06_00025 [Cardiobacteriaceae bacterium]|nr:hypothetical protein [Cardiobacteriaceae bacterium]